MLKKVLVKILTVSVCFVVAGTLIFVSSCEQTSPEPQAQNTGTQQPAEQVAAQPAATEPAAAEPATTEPAAAEPAEEPEVASAQEPTTETPAPAPAEEMGPIDIELPEAMFVGTPPNTSIENLEKPLGTARPPFLAPVGTTNVALGKPVTSSDSWPIIGKLDYVTNGDKSAADGHFVELAPFTQHVTIDLEGMFNIYAIVIWHYHMSARVYYDVIIQVADDAEFTQNVQTIFNNDIDNSSELGTGTNMHYTETNEGKLIDAKGIKGRYVRLYSQGNTENPMNHYIEVAVYGKAAQ